MLRKQLLVLSLLGLCLVVGFAWGGRTYEGRVVSVTDGDRIKVLVNGEQIKIRLAEIDAPENGQPWGRKASKALAEKIAKQTVNVDETGRDREGQIIGKVWLGERYINRELVREGHAWGYRKYLQDETLMEDEEVARSEARGLWRLPEAKRRPPWEWRQESRTGSAKFHSVATSSINPVAGGSKALCSQMTPCRAIAAFPGVCRLSQLRRDGSGCLQEFLSVTTLKISSRQPRSFDLLKLAERPPS